MPLNDYSRKSSKSSSLLRYNKVFASSIQRPNAAKFRSDLKVLRVARFRESYSHASEIRHARVVRACVHACTLLIAYIQ